MGTQVKWLFESISSLFVGAIGAPYVIASDFDKDRFDDNRSDVSAHPR
jgi:hypothetical protein